MKLITSIAASLCAVLGFAAPALATCDTTSKTDAPTSRYVIGGGTVYDKKTNLTWQRCSVGQSWMEGMGCTGAVKNMAWDEAMKQATGGWRLPTKGELETLISRRCSYPAMNDEVFPGMNDIQKLSYWASNENGNWDAWAVGFTYGYSYSGTKLNTFAVRLVRSGK